MKTLLPFFLAALLLCAGCKNDAAKDKEIVEDVVKIAEDATELTSDVSDALSIKKEL